MVRHRARAATVASLPPSSLAVPSGSGPHHKQRWGLYNRKRRPPVDLKRQMKQAEMAFDMYGSEPDDDPVIAAKTRYKREYIMREWIEYWENSRKENGKGRDWMEPNEIWYGLCRDDFQAQRLCKVFWRGFLLNSHKWVPVLDLKRPEIEYEERPGISSAVSLLTHWRSLVAQANNIVLSSKRLDERRNGRGNPYFWNLTFRDDRSSIKRGPIYEISKWIVHDLAKEFNLAREIMVEKVEATDEDVILIAETLWQRADDIICGNDTRIDFNAFLIIASIVGCRPGVLGRLTYSQFNLAYIRDPRVRSRFRLVASIDLERNKQRRATLLANKPKTIRFAVTLVPHKPICLASIIFSRAIAKDAFDGVSFESAEALLHRPNLDDADYIPLPWKEKFWDLPLFEMSYTTFNKLWRRSCLVAGLRKDERLYTLRVGAASRLDGTLSDCLRNYVLDQSTGVFQSSYQAHTVRRGLAGLAFKKQIGHGDDSLFDVLRNLSLKRDSGAPIYISQEYSDLIESRSDMRELQEDAYQARVAGDDKLAEKYRHSRLSLRRHLVHIALTAQRQEYFRQVDDRRRKGQSTADLSSRQPKPLPTRASTSYPAADIARFIRFMRQRNPVADADAEVVSERYSATFIDLLVQFQTGRPGESWVPPAWEEEQQREAAATQESAWASEGIAAHDSTWGPPGTDSHRPLGQPHQHQHHHGLKDNGQPRCLICLRTLFNRSGLTRHYSIHVGAGYFNQRFKCPECCRLGMEDAWIEHGKSEYASHVERVHGKLHAPHFPSEPTSKGLHQIRCIICCRKFNRRDDVTRHYQRTHDEKEKLFDKPYQCPECGQRDILGVEAWIEHFRASHGESAIGPLPVRPSDTSELKRKHAFNDPSEPPIEATRTTDDRCKKPKTCSVNNNYDFRSGSGDGYRLDVAKDRTAIKDATIQTMRMVSGPGALPPPYSPESDALSNIDPVLLYNASAVYS